MWNLSLLALMLILIPGCASSLKVGVPQHFLKPSAFVKRVDSIQQQEQRDANRFCTPDFEYAPGQPIVVYPCTPLPDCDSMVLESDLYFQRCPSKI